MKRILSVLLIVVMLFSLCACGETPEEKVQKIVEEEIIEVISSENEVADNFSISFGHTKETGDGEWKVAGVVSYDCTVYGDERRQSNFSATVLNGSVIDLDIG